MGVIRTGGGGLRVTWVKRSHWVVLVRDLDQVEVLNVGEGGAAGWPCSIGNGIRVGKVGWVGTCTQGLASERIVQKERVVGDDAVRDIEGRVRVGVAPFKRAFARLPFFVAVW